MHSRRDSNIHTYVGSFASVKLDFSADPPLSEREKYKHKANYPTTLAKLHIYLDGEDAARPTSSAYLLFVLDHLLAGVPLMVKGQSITASWFSDAWQLDLQGHPQQNRVEMTLHIPGKWTAMQGVGVELIQFGEELITLSQRWERYLGKVYRSEIVDSSRGRDFRQFKEHLIKAIEVLRQYRVP